MRWDELDRKSPEIKDRCTCAVSKPKHVIISKTLDFWICTKCKKECDEPCNFKLVNDLDDIFRK